MIIKFLSLQYKQFFRSSYWQRTLVLNILMGFLALYMLVVFLSIGLSAYFILKEKFPNQDPLYLINSFLIFWWIGDLLMRYFGQKIPEMAFRPFLILPLKKRKIAQYILLKLSLSFYVFLPLILFTGLAGVLVYKSYDSFYISIWFLTILLLILGNNYLNLVINNNIKIRNIFLVLFAGGVLLYLSHIVPLTQWSAGFFERLHNSPWLVGVAVFWAVFWLWAAYHTIKDKLYLDALLGHTAQQVQTYDFKFTDRLGETGLYYKNALKKIWRNKRTRAYVYNLIFVSLIGLFYIKLLPGKTPDDTLRKFVMAAFFMTILVSSSYGQMIPSFDSAYYPFLMAQKVNFKKYLKAEYLIMTTMNLIVLSLSVFYMFFSWKYFVVLLAFTTFTIGIINPFLLWNGAYNTKRIDLNKKSFGNSQGISGRLLLISFLLGLLPFLLFFVLLVKVGFLAAVIVFTSIGLLGILFHDYLINKITGLYIKKKYKTLHGFKQLN